MYLELLIIHEIIESKDLIEYVIDRVSGELLEIANALNEFLKYIQKFNEETIKEEEIMKF